MKINKIHIKYFYSSDFEDNTICLPKIVIGKMIEL